MCFFSQLMTQLSIQFSMVLRRLGASVMLLAISSIWLGCKRPHHKSPDFAGAESQVKGGVRDTGFIFLLAPHATWSPHNLTFEFITCKLAPKSNAGRRGARSFIGFSNPANNFMPQNDKVQERIDMLSRNPRNYPVNDVANLLGPQIMVLADTCVPAFRGMRGQPLKLVATDVTQEDLILSKSFIDNERFIIEREQGRHYMAAFGIGSAFSSFNKNAFQAFQKIIPNQLHQLRFLPRSWGQRKLALKEVPWIGKILRFNVSMPTTVSTPFVSEMGLGMVAMGQNEPFDVFEKVVFDRENFSLLRPDVEPIGRAEEIAGISGSVAAGAITGHILVSNVARATSTLPGHVGPVATIASALATPFMTTVIMESLNNPAQEVLDNFQAILEGMSRPTGARGESHAADSSQVKSSLRTIVPLLGKSFVVAQWVGPLDLYSACFPNDSERGYECFSVMENKEVTNNLPMLSSLASSPVEEPEDSCLVKEGFLHRASDRGMTYWQGYMNCRFYGGGEQCAIEYSCSLPFSSASECEQWGEKLNEVRRDMGSGSFAKATIEHYCSNWKIRKGHD